MQQLLTLMSTSHVEFLRKLNFEEQHILVGGEEGEGGRGRVQEQGEEGFKVQRLAFRSSSESSTLKIYRAAKAHARGGGGVSQGPPVTMSQGPLSKCEMRNPNPKP